MKPLTIHELADVDVDRALDYYAAEAPRAARALLSAFRKTLDRIVRAPAAGSPRYGQLLGIEGLRHRATPRFPYLIFYVESPGGITVIRVLHQRSDIPTELLSD